MRISFLCNYVDGGWKPDDTRLGGTEESIVEWAKELSKLGHSVDVYDNDNRNSYKGGGDICINIKSSEIAPKEPTLYLTNEVDATNKDLSAYAGVIWPSKWARDNIPVNNPNLFIVPHGYDDKKINSQHKKISKQCFYASSPDRGLETLLEAWPKVHKAHPDATLLLTYGVEGVDLSGVTCLGDVDENTMNDIFNTSDIWCHPASGGELYCITGIKAQAAGCWPVIIPTMALQETIKYGTFATKENYADKLIEALDAHPEPPKNHYPTWQDSATMLEDIILKVTEKQNGLTANRNTRNN